MLRFKSIFSRIIFLHTIAVVLTAILMPSVLLFLLNSEVTDLQRTTMLKQADRLARHLSRRADGSWAFNLPPELQSQYSSDYGRYFYAVIDKSRNVLFSSLKTERPIFASDALKPKAASLTVSERGSDISGVSLPKTINGQNLWIQVAEDLSHRDVLTDDVVRHFVQRVGWITLPVLILLLTIDILIFRRAARPLLEVSERALAITPKRLDVRLPATQIPIEIQPLVQAINQALERLEHGFTVQREFTADAAHELRTPLTILRNRTDQIADPKIAKALREDISGMTRIISQMLDIAELDALTIGPSDSADLESVCIRVIEDLAPLALADGKNIAFSGTDTPVHVRGKEEALYRALRNLIENAISQTAPATTVEVALKNTGAVSIADEGPGIRNEERELIFRRFWRRDRRAPGSAGLGLAIVQRIIETHGGRISVENRPTGGACFTLTFELVGKALDPVGFRSL
jgi:signal transduction histidine kinase